MKSTVWDPGRPVVGKGGCRGAEIRTIYGERRSRNGGRRRRSMPTRGDGSTEVDRIGSEDTEGTHARRPNYRRDSNPPIHGPRRRNS